MQLHTISEASALRQAAVEVKIWEGYLLRNKTNLPNTLCAYSLDDGPWHETDDARFIFRFAAFDWFNNIQQLLTRQNIHCDLIRHFQMDPSPHARAPKVSLVTDDTDLSTSIMSGLEAAGYRVSRYTINKPVLAECINHADLFIIDKQMADIDGLRICRHLRTHPATKDIPSILLSRDAAGSKEALLAGATDFILKPFHIHYLLNVVGRYTRQEW